MQVQKHAILLPKISILELEYGCGQKYFRERDSYSCMQICIFEYQALGIICRSKHIVWQWNMVLHLNTKMHIHSEHLTCFWVIIISWTKQGWTNPKMVFLVQHTTYCLDLGNFMLVKKALKDNCYTCSLYKIRTVLWSNLLMYIMYIACAGYPYIAHAYSTYRGVWGVSTCMYLSQPWVRMNPQWPFSTAMSVKTGSWWGGAFSGSIHCMVLCDVMEPVMWL